MQQRGKQTFQTLQRKCGFKVVLCYIISNIISKEGVGLFRGILGHKANILKGCQLFFFFFWAGVRTPDLI